MQPPPRRIVSGQAFDEDVRIEASVRPKCLSAFIGQGRVKEIIGIAIEADAIAVFPETAALCRHCGKEEACR